MGLEYKVWFVVNIYVCVVVSVRGVRFVLWFDERYKSVRYVYFSGNEWMCRFF